MKTNVYVKQQVRGAANPPQYQSTQPAIMQPTQEIPPPPTYTKTAQQTQQPQLSAAEFQVSIFLCKNGISYSELI